jgi:uncharacterized cupin superfamily protein
MADPKTLSYHRCYCDTSDESHIEEIEIKQSMAQAAPPAPPFLVSAFTHASSFGFFSAPVGWFGDLHPAPARQFMILLSGEMEIEASDGHKLNMKPGDILLLEDTLGKGHRSRNTSFEVSHFFVVRTPPQ